MSITHKQTTLLLGPKPQAMRIHRRKGTIPPVTQAYPSTSTGRREMLRDKGSWTSRAKNIDTVSRSGHADIPPAPGIHENVLSQCRSYGLIPMNGNTGIVFFMLREEMWFRFVLGPARDIDPLNDAEFPVSMLDEGTIGPALVISNYQLDQIRAVSTALKDYDRGKIELGIEEIARLRAALPESPVDMVVGGRKTEMIAELDSLAKEIGSGEEE